MTKTYFTKPNFVSQSCIGLEDHVQHIFCLTVSQNLNDIISLNFLYLINEKLQLLSWRAIPKLARVTYKQGIAWRLVKKKRGKMIFFFACKKLTCQMPSRSPLKKRKSTGSYRYLNKSLLAAVMTSTIFRKESTYVFWNIFCGYSLTF